jgi:hypothetical protein
MPKRTVIIAALMCISCLPSAFGLVSFASSPSLGVISSSGNIAYEVIPAVRKMKYICAYGLGPPVSEPYIPQIAKFDLLDADFEIGPDLPKLRALNPNMTILGYKDVIAMTSDMADYAEATQHEDWFLHDLNGNRLVNKYWGFEAMDAGSPGWRQHYADYLNKRFQQYGFDGVFADDVWNWSDYHNTVWTVDASLVPPEIQLRWNKDMVGFLQFVKNQTGNKLLIANCGFEPDYIACSDGFMDESFVHPDRYSQYEFYDDTIQPESHVEELQYWSGLGKLVMCQSGCTERAAGQEPFGLMMYCYCSFLLGINGTAGFGWNSIYAATQGYWPEMDINIGNPKGGFVHVNDLLCSREFDNATVFVNFSADTTYQVNVNETTYTLPPHSGLVAS